MILKYWINMTILLLAKEFQPLRYLNILWYGPDLALNTTTIKGQWNSYYTFLHQLMVKFVILAKMLLAIRSIGLIHSLSLV